MQKKFQAILSRYFPCFCLKLLVLKKSEKLKNRGVWFDTDVPVDIYHFRKGYQYNRQTDKYNEKWYRYFRANEKKGIK